MMHVKGLGTSVLFIGLLMCLGCKSKPPAEPAYTSAEGAVGFDIKLVSGPANLEQPTLWLATHKSSGHTATFRIELGASQRSASPSISFGKGRLLAVPGSDAAGFLPELRKALEAKTIPQKAARVSDVPFAYAVLGGPSRREKDGSFTTQGNGNWVTLKLFFGEGDEEAEVYLNLNPVLGKGEFSIKDPDYGDAVVGKLAKVL